MAKASAQGGNRVGDVRGRSQVRGQDGQWTMKDAADAATLLKVPRWALKSYMEEYHHNNGTGRCKADGEEFPCLVYRTLKEALDAQWRPAPAIPRETRRQ